MMDPMSTMSCCEVPLMFMIYHPCIVSNFYLIELEFEFEVWDWVLQGLIWWNCNCSLGDIKQEVGLYRDGPTYQRRGSLQLWQFLVALLDDPSNSHFIAWTGRGMEFKLIEPEEVRADLKWSSHHLNRSKWHLSECFCMSMSVMCYIFHSEKNYMGMMTQVSYSMQSLDHRTYCHVVVERQVEFL